MNRLAVFVASCDKYSDLWDGFFYCLQRYWPDNPYPVYLGSNERTYNLSNLTVLKSVTSDTWSGQLRKQLCMITEEYVLLMLDDFFLRRSVDSKWIKDIFSYLVSSEACMVRLIPRPPPELSGDAYPFVGACPNPHPYRICTQSAIWKKSALVELLNASESIWQFEYNAEMRVRKDMGGFYAVTRDALPYRGLLFHHVVEKGKWIPSEIARCKIRGVPTGGGRGILSARAFFLLVIAECYNSLLVARFGPGSHRVRKKLFAYMPAPILKCYRRLRKYPEELL